MKVRYYEREKQWEIYRCEWEERKRDHKTMEGEKANITDGGDFHQLPVDICYSVPGVWPISLYPLSLAFGRGSKFSPEVGSRFELLSVVGISPRSELSLL